MLERRRGRKGIGRLRRIAQEVDPQALETRSVTEIDFLALCREANLSTPSVNVLVEDHLVDFLWSAQKVVVETDSWSHHRDRPTFERDHQTDVDLIAAGYDVHRTTYKMLERDPAPSLGTSAALSASELHQLLYLLGGEVDAVRTGEVSGPRRRRGPGGVTPRRVR